MYSDYLNKLHFGSVSDGIQAMKDHEIASQTNPLELKSLGLDSDIDKLTGQLADVQDSTDPATTIENAVSEAGGAIEGMATMKKLYSKFKDMKSKAGDKIKELKGKAQDKVNEAKGGETKSDAPDGQEVEMHDMTDPTEGQSTIGQAPDDVGRMEDFDDAVDDDVHDDIRGLDDADYGQPSFLRSSQDVQDLNKQPDPAGDHNLEIAENDPQTAGRELETAENNLSNKADQVNNTLRSDTGKLDAAIKENAGSSKKGDGDDGEADADEGEIEDEVAVDAEEAGTELDATGIGAVVGIVLNVGGLILGAVSGSEDASTKSVDETSIQNSITADQNKINQIKQQELNIKSQIAQQHFTGANIVPNISSTTLNNVTSSSF